MSKEPTAVDVAPQPGPRRTFNHAYLLALEYKERTKPRRKYVKIHCKTFVGGLKALLRACGEQI